MLQNSQVVFALLLLCEALAAPIVPRSEVNRKMEAMEVKVRFDGRAGQTPLEEYVAAVLAKESGNFRSDEALKAMAVAVRSYALHFRGRHEREGFDENAIYPMGNPLDQSGSQFRKPDKTN